MFATRIGTPSFLCLTPNDSRAFLTKIAEFASELTKETVM
jgi:hypothetical protein